MSKVSTFAEVFFDYPFLAAGASFFQAGLGQVLCGRMKRGIMILISTWLLNYASYVIQILETITYVVFSSTITYMVLIIVRLFITVWAVYDAYRIAQSHVDVH